MTPKCEGCQCCQGYYRYKTATRGRPRLVTYYCEHPDGIPVHGNGKRFIVYSRYGVGDKMKTSPRFCPIRPTGDRLKGHEPTQRKPLPMSQVWQKGTETTQEQESNHVKTLGK